MDINGKVAFITGGGGGIGVGMAEAFAEKGMKLALADVDIDYAREAAAAFGDNAVALELDVTSLESWARAKAAVAERFGAVDVLCNNAGISTERMPLDELPPEVFARVMAVNVTGVYNGIHTFAGEMRARGSGHIVNTSSMNGLLAHGTYAAYSASKFAVTAISEAVRDELAPFGVGVSCLFPGLTRSRMSTAPKTGAGAEGIPKEVLEASMMEPVWLGRAVVRAIEADDLYIVSHPEYKDAVAARMERILAAHGEPAQPDYKNSLSAARARK